MLPSLFPREAKFFDLFNDLAEQLVKGSHELQALVSDLGHVEQRARNIKTIENHADQITHQTVLLLHQTFITPLDRDDIHRLVTRMDDILDLMEDASQCMFLYDIRTLPAEAVALVGICVACTEKVREAVAMLPNMKNAERLMHTCTEIDQLESEADHVTRAAMVKLFRDENDTKLLIKLKEIYEHLENVTDRCEDVANILEGIVLEHA